MPKAKTGETDMSARIASARDYKPLFLNKLTETHLFCGVGRIIASELETAELVRKIMTSIGRAISFEDASAYVVKKDLSCLEPIYFSSPLLQNKLSDTIYFDNGAPGEIAASGEPLFLNDSSRYETFLHHPDEPQKQGCYMGIPLKNETRIVGVMGFSHSKAAAFSIEDFDILRTLSHTISAGIEKAELLKKTIEIARTDELTGMLNYRVLLEKLEEEFARQVRTGRDLSFIMVDIDDFKQVNDRYGHLEGSRLIAQMGPLLREACRMGSTDNCFRYGGEEFSLLLAETGIEDALAVAERVRKSVEEYPFTLKAVHPSEIVTVSLGVSTMRKGDNKTLIDLINESDVALYRSKATGKNRATAFSPDLTMPGDGRDSHEIRP